MDSTICQLFRLKKKNRPIAFANRQFTEAKRNYMTTKREVLAMVFLVLKYQYYLLLSIIVVYVVYMILCYLVKKPDLSGRTAYQILLLQEFD